MADYKNLIPFIKLAEGGLSSAKTDNAKKFSAPCGKGKNGYLYHTNKGIKYQTFVNNAKKLNYAASCDNFLKMPDWLWEKIYKQAYWDQIKGDEIKNQAIANTFVEWTWGGRKSLSLFFKEAYKQDLKNIDQIVDFVNDLDKIGKTPELFEALYNYRNDYFVSLNQPANIKGWINRLNSFYILNKPYALSKASKTTIGISVGIGGILLITLAYKIYGKYTNSK